MVAFLVRRLCGLIFVLLAVTFLTFIIGHAAPGDPIQLMLGTRQDPALLPVVTFLSPSIAGLITGTFVAENIFNLPGVGFAAVTSLQARDYPVVQGATIIVATLVVVMNVIADILYRVLDPRIQE